MKRKKKPTPIHHSGLQIRSEQMKAFQPVADANFVKRLVAQLRDEHAETAVVLSDRASTVEKLPDEVLRELVAAGIARARTYGLSHESALAAFVAIMFEAAPNFDRHPLIQRLLNDEKTPPDARIDLLLEEATEENWQAVKKSYDPRSWNPPPEGNAP
jgi:non-ribosomal peptide synthetase component F